MPPTRRSAMKAAPPPPPPPAAEGGLTDYERLREENIRRNDAILASLRRQAAELSASLRPASPPPKRPRKQPPPPASPVVLRRSLRTRGLAPDAAASPPTPPSPAKPRDRRFSPSLASSLRDATSSAEPQQEGKICLPADGFDAGSGMVLRPADVRRVVPERILSVCVLPLAERTVVVAGNKLGHIGFWDVDGVVEEEEDGDGVDGVFEYLPHKGPVGAIVAHPAAPRKIYSCSYEGEICLMDVEKENFDMIQLCDYPVYSLCQEPNSPSCLYFGEVDFHPENPYMFATSSTDRTACIWDMRSMKKNGPESLKVFGFDRSVQSAYFSPSGSMLATTSLDDAIRIVNVDKFDGSYMLKHNNKTGRWLSTFKAIWSWSGTDLFIGNMKRAIDVIAVDVNENGLSASYKACLESEHMTAIPCRFALHPYKVGHLACASSGGKVFLWTKA
ncbi:hypothetical protein ACP4OV_031056 [Aristida adscensionis]